MVLHIRRVVVGLGSNVGDRADYLKRAVAAIREEPEVFVLGHARVYECAAHGEGITPQADFLNTAVLLATGLRARALLERLLRIEGELGRVRKPDERWQPRTIDLDILWVEGEYIDEPGLTVPHARLGSRPFALEPLVELVPDAEDPRTRVRFASLAWDKSSLRPADRDTPV